MDNIMGCYILLKDDFDNILFVQKGKKKNPSKWQLVGRERKGKECEEKCINNSIKEELNTLVFELEEFKDFIYEGKTFKIYTGKIKDFMNLGKGIINSEWISKNRMNSFDMDSFSKEIVEDYFNSL